MYFTLYTGLGWLLIIGVMPFFVPIFLLTGKRLAGLGQRFGLFDPAYPWRHQQRLWLHAASVGEVQAATALITTLRQLEIKVDIIVTTVTEQGHLAAKRQLQHTALCLYAPIDLPWVINRFLWRLRPSLYVCLETELWPNMLRLARARGVQTLLLNGRLSDRAFRRYRMITALMRQVLRCFNSASVIRAIDRERYIALGFDPARITVNGNAKYDLAIETLFVHHDRLSGLSGATLREGAASYYQEILGLAPDQPVLLAGSTHTGEEEMMLTAFEALLLTIPDLVLIIAPRHLDRLERLMEDWQAKGIAYQTFSQLQTGKRTTRLIVVDRMGELAKMYAVATYVFCGGSLVARGGHNIMEPVIWGKPPIYGPHMNDFRDACTLLEEHEAGYPITTVHELIETIRYFHRHQDQYRQAVQRALALSKAQQGSALRQVEMIRQALA